MKPLFLTICFFAFGNVHAELACDPVTLKNIYSTQSFIADFTGKLYVDMSEVKEQLTHGYTFDISMHNVKMEIYGSDPCEPNGLILDIVFDTSDEFTIDTLPPLTKFLKFTHSEGKKFKAKITLHYPPQLPECDLFNNRRNEHENPVKLTDLYPDDAIFEDCNTWCENFSANGTPIKFYEMYTQNLDFVEIITLDSNMITQLYGIKNGLLYSIGNIYAKEGSIMNVTQWDTIQFALGKIETGEYKFTLKRYTPDSTCVDFFISGDTLLNLTSPAVAENTTYLSGDTVDFEYRLMSWAPIYHNYFHGLGFTFGNGWRGIALTEEGEPDIEFEMKFGLSYTYNHVDVLYEDDPDYYHLEGISGDLVIPGLYFNENNPTPPSGPNSSFFYGFPFSNVLGTFEDPLFRVKFSLIVSNDIPCDSIADGYFSVRALSDFETGREINKGCFEHELIEQSYEIDNCSVSSTEEVSKAFKPHLKVFPNPASDLINIEFEKDIHSHLNQLSIYTIYGGHIKTLNNSDFEITNGHSTSIDIGFLEVGKYVLQIKSNDAVNFVIFTKI